ncbi:Alpha/Beta hydrolase protein [Xylariales sp. AK1849]|nr:Alpha/Beta hydrolase protein [Xylariales sp. AK1849]
MLRSFDLISWRLPAYTNCLSACTQLNCKAWNAEIQFASRRYKDPLSGSKIMASSSTLSPNLSPTELVEIPWRHASLVVHLRRVRSADSNLKPIIVFVNGLGRPMAEWAETIRLLPIDYTLIAYDRFGQGVSPHLPADVPEELRDGAAAARDLYELLNALTRREQTDLLSAPIILVAHSIGVAIARLLMINHDIRVAAALCLDPSPVNSDFVSLYPAPRDDEPADLTATREATRRIFHPSVPNPENFNRKNFAKLLPYSERPVLEDDPYVTVVAHDPPVAFGEASEKMGIKPEYALKYVEPYWQDYNKKLLQSVTSTKRRGPLTADGADHFIQVGRPDIVAAEIRTLVHEVSGKRNPTAKRA